MSSIVPVVGAWFLGAVALAGCSGPDAGAGASTNPAFSSETGAMTSTPGTSSSAAPRPSESGSALPTTGSDLAPGTVDVLPATEFGELIRVTVPAGWTSSNDEESQFYVAVAGTDLSAAIGQQGGSAATVEIMVFATTGYAGSALQAATMVAEAIVEDPASGVTSSQGPTDTTLAGRDAVTMQYGYDNGGKAYSQTSWVFRAGDTYVGVEASWPLGDAAGQAAAQQIVSSLAIG